MKNLRLSTELALAFTLMVLLLMSISAISLYRSSIQRDATQSLAVQRIPISRALATLSDRVHVQAVQMRNLLIFTDAQRILAAKKRIAESRTEVAAQYAILGKLVTSDEGQRVLRSMAEARAVFVNSEEEFNKLVDQGNHEEARRYLLDVFRPAQIAYEALIANQTQVQTQLTQASVEQAEDASDNLRRDVLISSVIGVGLAIFLAILLIRAITRPLARAVTASNQVAAGDLSTPILVDSRNEVGQLLAALERMRQSLARTVSAVRHNAENVAAASAQIASGNNDLSSRTENPASALEETAASMEELGTTVRQNDDNARTANELAITASSVAQKGGDVVAKVVLTMNEIRGSSNKISEIISVIDSIAFQTNILALNAAVEAARAGEQGRGFAVVAGEVRTLAKRCADAAKEIKTLITASVQQVSQGTELVDNAGATMTDVVTAIRRVTNIMGGISTASHDQSIGVSQVGEAVAQMDEVTQQNAALVEEMAAAASSLTEQATALVSAVAVFKLGQDTGSAPITRPVSMRQPAPAVPLPLKRPASRTLAAPSPQGQRSGIKDDSDAQWESF